MNAKKMEPQAAGLATSVELLDGVAARLAERRALEAKKRPERNVENLVTTIPAATYAAIVNLLLERERELGGVSRPTLTPVRWVGRVARERVRQHGLAPFEERHVEAARVVVSATSVRIVATVPLGVAGPHGRLTEARWARACIAWALEERIVPAEPKRKGRAS